MYVGVLCALSSFNPCYSVAGVILTHLRLLSEFHKVVFITTEDFVDHDKIPQGVEVRKFPRWTCLAEDKVGRELYAKENAASFAKLFKNVSTCFVHDLLFVGGFEPANLLIKRSLPILNGSVKFYSICHSAPGNNRVPGEPIYEPAAGIDYVSLNRTDVPRMAKRFDLPETSIKVIHNMIDPVTLWNWHPLSKEMYLRYKLYEADNIFVYPTRISEGKGIEKLLKLAASLKELGKEVRVLILNSWSNGEKEKAYINDLKAFTILTSEDLVFSSELDCEWVAENQYPIELGVPQEVVQDMMRYADMFVLPSYSEACSLSMLEAGLGKNLCVLNEDVWSLQEFGGQKMSDNASSRVMYMQFGSVTRNISGYSPSEEEWYKNHAVILEEESVRDLSLQFFRYVRKFHNPYYVYWNQIAGLLR